MPFLLFSQELIAQAESAGSLSLACSFSEIGIGLSKVAPDSRSSGKGAKSLTRGGATRIEGRGEHPASVVDRQELT